MPRVPECYAIRVFVPDAKKEKFLASLVGSGLVTDPGACGSFRGSETGLVFGEMVIVSGSESAFFRLAQLLSDSDLTRYNPECFCDTYKPMPDLSVSHWTPSLN